MMDIIGIWFYMLPVLEFIVNNYWILCAWDYLGGLHRTDVRITSAYGEDLQGFSSVSTWAIGI